MRAKSSRAKGENLRAAAVSARTEIVEILAGAVFTLLLDGRFPDRERAEQLDPNNSANTGSSVSNSPCLVHQRTPSCPQAVDPASRRKEPTT